jgi:hypothetical protein
MRMWHAVLPAGTEMISPAHCLVFVSRRRENKLSACRGEGSAVGLQLQLRVRFVLAACCAAGYALC